jgi:hypothetical protein
MFLNKVAALPSLEKVDVPVPSSPTASTKAVNGEAESTSSSQKDGLQKQPKTVAVVKCVHPNFTDADLDKLAKKTHLNGRQIKNIVRSAQALAVYAEEDLKLSHLLQVLEIAETFESDIKGGTGYNDAMRSYM